MPNPDFLSDSPTLLVEPDLLPAVPRNYLAKEPTHFLNCTGPLRARVKASTNDRRLLSAEAPKKNRRIWFPTLNPEASP
ncbi:hypothetical protein AUI06_08530 [archaeon 13_2_20CM_2_52_21]|nr:MAG: hypothetical protein AUI06_08530 [archaeon 13_2_20CM_2_52_21]OLD09784.1 MAG: hypothetical protein AUI95_00130 [Crenarchaeota archaeon 13_1_40CM_3_52_4]